MPNSPDTKEAWEQAYQGAGHAWGVTDTAADWAAKPGSARDGQPKRSHRRPLRFLDCIEARWPPIGRFAPQYRIVSRIGCRVVFTHVRSRTELLASRVCSVTKCVNECVTMLHRCRSKHNLFPDIEPSSSEHIEGAEATAPAMDGSEAVVMRPPESLSWPIPANMRFDANGGAYACRRSHAKAGGNPTTPKAPAKQKGPSRLPRQDKKVFQHQRCRLCNHEHVFKPVTVSTCTPCCNTVSIIYLPGICLFEFPSVTCGQHRRRPGRGSSISCP